VSLPADGTPDADDQGIALGLIVSRGRCNVRHRQGRKWQPAGGRALLHACHAIARELRGREMFNEQVNGPLHKDAGDAPHLLVSIPASVSRRDLLFQRVDKTLGKGNPQFDLPT
jgi:hypothetical protein